MVQSNWFQVSGRLDPRFLEGDESTCCWTVDLFGATQTLDGETSGIVYLGQVCEGGPDDAEVDPGAFTTCKLVANSNHAPDVTNYRLTVRDHRNRIHYIYEFRFDATSNPGDVGSVLPIGHSSLYAPIGPAPVSPQPGHSIPEHEDVDPAGMAPNRALVLGPDGQTHIYTDLAGGAPHAIGAHINVDVAADTAATGKLLGATSVGQWGPVDAPVTGVEEAPEDGSGYVRQDAGWVAESAGVTDHGALSGLTPDDDHPQYHTDARGDARYDALGSAAAAQSNAEGTAAVALSGHEAASDPHPGYLTPAEGDAAYDALGAAAAAQGAAEATAAGALTAHHEPGSTDHDDRYYTETEVDNALGLKPDNLTDLGDVTDGTVGQVFYKAAPGDYQFKDEATGGTVDFISNVGPDVIIGRDTPGTGNSEELTPADARTLLDVNTTGEVTSAANTAQSNAEGTAAAALSGHEAAPDPHPGYLTPAEGDAAYDATGAATTAVSNHDTVNEHIDWTADQGATNIDPGNIPDLSALYGGAYYTVRDISGATGAIVAGDNRNAVRATSTGALTLTFPTAASLPAGFSVLVRNSRPNNAISIVRSGADTIDGSTTSSVRSLQGAIFISDGVSAWFTVGRVRTASETVPGIAQIATQTETNDGTIDTDMVSPLKLANYDRWATKADQSALTTHTGDGTIHYTDATVDGKQYARKDGAWAEVQLSVQGTYQGTYDAGATNDYPNGAGLVQGDYFIIDVAGTLGTVSFNAGDRLEAAVTTPTNNDADWFKVPAVSDHSALSNRTAVDSHPSTAVSFDNAVSGLAATTVKAALDEIDGNLDGHLADAVDAHDASAISVTAGNPVTATDVEAALSEVHDDAANAQGDATQALADAAAAVQPSDIGSTVQAWSADLDNVSGTNTGDEAAATTSVAGIAEIATSVEIDTGTDDTRVISPLGLAGSALQTTADSALQDITGESLTDLADVTDGTTGQILFRNGPADFQFKDEATGGTVDFVSNVAQDVIIGRTAAGPGDSEELTATQTRALLNVEDGSTADQTPAELMAAVQTVDGTGSGLDADLLDGLQATAFATATQGDTADTALQPGDTVPGTDLAGTWSAPTVVDDQHNHTTATITGLSGTNTGDETAASVRALGFFDITNDGTGSGLDADLLDGSHAADFATATQGSTAETALQSVVDDGAPALGGDLDVSGTAFDSTGDIAMRVGDDAGAQRISFRNNSDAEVAGISSLGDMTIAGTVDGRDISADGGVLDTALQPGDTVPGTDLAGTWSAPTVVDDQHAHTNASITLAPEDLTGTDVTATELETLTDGSNADLLHTHAGGTGTGTGNVWFVSTAGDDGDDGSVSTPVATINAAVTLASEGDTIFIARGETHPAATIGKNNITLRPWGIGDMPNIDGSGPTTENALYITGDNVTVEDIAFIDWFKRGIQNASGQGMHVRRCYFSGGNRRLAQGTYQGTWDPSATNDYPSGAGIVEGDYWIIEGNGTLQGVQFYDNYRLDAAVDTPSSTNPAHWATPNVPAAGVASVHAIGMNSGLWSVIEDNIFEDVGSWRDASGSWANFSVIYLFTGSHDITIRNNYIAPGKIVSSTNPGGAGIPAVACRLSDRVTIEGNHMEQSNVGCYIVSCQDIEIRDNWIHDGKGSGITMGGVTTWSDAVYGSATGDGPSDNGVIEGNVIENLIIGWNPLTNPTAPTGTWNGIDIFPSCDNLVVRGNKVRAVTRHCLGFDHYDTKALHQFSNGVSWHDNIFDASANYEHQGDALCVGFNMTNPTDMPGQVGGDAGTPFFTADRNTYIPKLGIDTVVNYRWWRSGPGSGGPPPAAITPTIGTGATNYLNLADWKSYTASVIGNNADANSNTTTASSGTFGFASQGEVDGGLIADKAVAPSTLAGSTLASIANTALQDGDTDVFLELNGNAVWDQGTLGLELNAPTAEGHLGWNAANERLQGGNGATSRYFANAFETTRDPNSTDNNNGSPSTPALTGDPQFGTNSTWTNTATDEAFICVDGTTGVWKSVTTAAAGGARPVVAVPGAAINLTDGMADQISIIDPGAVVTVPTGLTADLWSLVQSASGAGFSIEDAAVTVHAPNGLVANGESASVALVRVATNEFNLVGDVGNPLGAGLYQMTSATGDGTTNDSPAIDTDLTSGGNWYFPAGTYYLATECAISLTSSLRVLCHPDARFVGGSAAVPLGTSAFTITMGANIDEFTWSGGTFDMTHMRASNTGNDRERFPIYDGVNYTAETGTFTEGLVVTDGGSGATATIKTLVDNGTTGTLVFESDRVGTFIAGNAITDTSTGAATINGDPIGKLGSILAGAFMTVRDAGGFEADRVLMENIVGECGGDWYLVSGDGSGGGETYINVTTGVELMEVRSCTWVGARDVAVYLTNDKTLASGGGPQSVKYHDNHHFRCYGGVSLKGEASQGVIAHNSFAQSVFGVKLSEPGGGPFTPPRIPRATQIINNHFDVMATGIDIRAAANTLVSGNTVRGVGVFYDWTGAPTGFAPLDSAPSCFLQDSGIETIATGNVISDKTGFFTTTDSVAVYARYKNAQGNDNAATGCHYIANTIGGTLDGPGGEYTGTVPPSDNEFTGTTWLPGIGTKAWDMVVGSGSKLENDTWPKAIDGISSKARAGIPGGTPIGFANTIDVPVANGLYWIPFYVESPTGIDVSEVHSRIDAVSSAPNLEFWIWKAAPGSFSVQGTVLQNFTLASATTGVKTSTNFGLTVPFHLDPGLHWLLYTTSETGTEFNFSVYTYPDMPIATAGSLGANQVGSPPRAWVHTTGNGDTPTAPNDVWAEASTTGIWPQGMSSPLQFQWTETA